jgi:hypothetical protein
MRRFLKAIDDGSLEVSLRLLDTLAAFDPLSGELLVVGGQLKHFRASALAQRGECVVKKELHYAIRT